ncbi:MAG TPA: hypothetical protein ENK06_13620, partial [Gammaproteobacteria bacterium]|nr:hypothetical protein [Gammaproteobacteria bacterium]
MIMFKRNKKRIMAFAGLVNLVLIYLMPSLGFALDVSSLQLNSALNQVLDARIELLSLEQETSGLTVSLAPEMSYAERGIEYPPILKDVELSIEVSANGLAYI